MILKGIALWIHWEENDNEVKGFADQIDYGMRVYDPRVGRFMSVDPLYRQYPWNSMYSYAENDVLRNIDLDGGEKKHYLLIWDAKRENATLTYSHSENFTETTKKWSPTWSNWFRTTTSTVKNPRVEYVVHGTVTIPMSADGMFKDDVRAVTWTFESSEKMAGQERARRAHRGSGAWTASHDWDYVSSDQHWDITLGQMATYGVEAQVMKSAYSPNPFLSEAVEGAVQRITLKDFTPSRDGGSYGFSLINGKINLTGRSVTNAKLDFVVTVEGELEIGSKHFILSSGAKEVQAAGSLRIFKGKVMEINNNSGHYKPSEAETANFGTILKKAGVDVSGAKLNTLNANGDKVGIKVLQ